MGGSGGGGHNRKGRLTTEGSLRIEVRPLLARGFLRSDDPSRPTWGPWSWSCRERPSGSCTVSGWRGGIEVAGKWRPSWGSENGWREFRSRAAVIWQPCRYGGERPFLECQHCGASRTFLILDGLRLACRVCLRRPYGSQGEDAVQRAWRKARKIAARLGSNNADGYMPKPKAMHARTYDRLLDKLADAHVAREAAWTVGAVKLLDRMSPCWRTGDLRPPARRGRRSRFWE
jgi:hypothetical protein